MSILPSSHRFFVFSEFVQKAWLFLTSKVIEAVAVGGQKRMIESAHFGTLTQCLVHPTAPYLESIKLVSLISTNWQIKFAKLRPLMSPVASN